MKTIALIGAYEKTDLILCISKIMTMAGKKVLFVDTTITQKARYVIPSIAPTKAYITEFEGIDIAVGFENFKQINEYVENYDATRTDYDVAIIDIDTIESLSQLNIHSIEKKFFVTSFDVYSLKRGLEVFTNLKEPVKLTKVLFSKNLLEEENEYLDYLASQYKIEWDDYIVAFPLTDESVIIENHSVSKIRLKKLSEQYKLSLEYLVQYILDDVPAREISKARANAEREG